MYRVAVEALLGLRMDGGALTIDPCIPADWSGYHLTYRYFSASYEIQVENPHGVNHGVHAVTLDGAPLPDGRIIRYDDGRVHHVHVEMGP
jgi:cyclic beta-1,2-glucan synthetase